MNRYREVMRLGGHGRDEQTIGHAEFDRRPIAVFIRFDRIGSATGLILVIVANGLFFRRPLVWAIVAPLLLLTLALTYADRSLAKGGLLLPLVLLTIGNWITAVVVAFVLPFLWPVMVITVLMPIVLAANYLDRSQLLATILATMTASGLVAGLGLVNDDGGALPDIDDTAELVLVIGALAAHVVPSGLIVWQNNRVQLERIQRADTLNDHLISAQSRLAASRRRVVDAADTERRRIERDLHDGAQQRLVTLGVRLRLLQAQTTAEPQMQAAIDPLLTELDQAIEEIRELAHGIYPPLLRSQGLPPALRAVARRSPLAVDVTLEDVARHDPSAETALYFTALEALTNAAKHAPDASVELTLRQIDDELRLVVDDDGPGFDVDQELKTQGTHNMGDRVAAAGGELRITSEPGRGTTVTASVPLLERSGDIDRATSEAELHTSGEAPRLRQT